MTGYTPQLAPGPRYEPGMIKPMPFSIQMLAGVFENAVISTQRMNGQRQRGGNIHGDGRPDPGNQRLKSL